MSEPQMELVKAEPQAVALPPFDQRAEAVLACVYQGLHHCPGIKKAVGSPGRWEVNHYGDLSTFDFNALTRLVIAAHDMCVRASVQHRGSRGVKIVLHERQCREGNFCHRHPTMEQAIEAIRKSIPTAL